MIFLIWTTILSLFSRIDFILNVTITTDDILRGLNLLFNLKTFKMAYPEFKIQDDSTKSKPRLLAIGDSYWWNICNPGISNTVFSDNKFWYYNNAVYPDYFTKPTIVKDLNLKDEIAKTDVIIIIATAPTIKELGWGFVDNCYKLFKTKNSNSAELKSVIADWMKEIKERLAKEGLSVDSIIKLDVAGK